MGYREAAGFHVGQSFPNRIEGFIALGLRRRVDQFLIGTGVLDDDLCLAVDGKDDRFAGPVQPLKIFRGLPFKLVSESMPFSR